MLSKNAFMCKACMFQIYFCSITSSIYLQEIFEKVKFVCKLFFTLTLVKSDNFLLLNSYFGICLEWLMDYHIV